MMDRLVVVDTNVLSFLIKLKNNQLEKDLDRAKEYLKYLQGRIIVRAFPTEAELLVWWNKTDDGKRKEQYRKGIDEIIEQTSNIDGDSSVAIKWADIITKGNELGLLHVHDSNNPKRESQLNDTWIAACALAYDFPLVSDNFRDFGWMQDALGLKLVCLSQKNKPKGKTSTKKEK